MTRRAVVIGNNIT